MYKVLDKNLHPRMYLSSAVITVDQNGYPTLTRFYSGELQTGYTMFEWVTQYYISSAITNESFTSVFDTPVQLANTNIVSGTAVVTSTDGLTTFTEGSDYTMDYINGKITVLSTGTMVNSTAYHISYDYMLANSIGKQSKFSVQNINTSV